MRAAVLHSAAIKSASPLKIEDRPVPEPEAGDVLLRVEACGVCRTDLHITMGELKALHEAIVPGHQIVGRVTKCGEGVSAEMPSTTRPARVSLLYASRNPHASMVQPGVSAFG